ncbi:4Fe-4S binding protein [Sedimentitalea sp. XS_ASV28]|uniref:4Fe-4S binding protein n=1 Tax=Sedimentitalea sp. XS_ASV28 TaxID=3241296 RepID=UPI00351823F6
MTKSLILCDCMGTQRIDPEAISDVCGVACSRVHSALCTTEIMSAAALMDGGEAIIACGQEQVRLGEFAEEIGVEQPGSVDLRDRAGWSEQGADATPKMAALVAEALLPAPERRSVDVVSHGVCFIVGPGEVALELAAQLADALAVTVFLTDDTEPPALRTFDVVRGRLTRVSGAFGGFEILIDALQQVVPGGRGTFGWGAPQDGARSTCDIVIDVSGATPMVPAPEKREGYLRADPRDRSAVQKCAFEAVQMTGTFEKPLYVRLDETLCAHSRAGQVGCSKCLDICPTGAITPDGDQVAIDPMVCAGCGSCAALCPSTAITYQDPPVGHVVTRLRRLAEAFRAAGGATPRLLVHDAHGAEMIRLAARFGRGLPADVIPLELGVVSGFGHAEMLAALAQGFASVHVLLAPATERDALLREATLAEAMGAAGRVILLDESDPDLMSDALYAATVDPVDVSPVLTLGNRRQIARLSAQALNPAADAPLPLPAGAPYGAVQVDTDACSLCLSCVSLCPSGALIDNPDMPQLRFQEDACLQCGICRTICPEQAITLTPQMDTSDAALTQRVLHEEEPFACIECGALFGVKSTVERVMDKLAGSHPMFASSEQAKLIRMCDDCRVNRQFRNTDNPFAGNDKPRVRTTDDYLSGRRDH